MDVQRPAAAQGSRDELVRRAAAGDVPAFARIVRLHHEPMTRAALVVTGDVDRAAKAAEAALLDAWLALRHPPVPDDVGAWLCARAVAEAQRLAPQGDGPRPSGGVPGGPVATASIPPIDADALARRARAEEVLEGQRRLSVAVGLMAGFLVAVHPYLAGLLLRH